MGSPSLDFFKLNTNGAFNHATGTASTIPCDHCDNWTGGLHRMITADSSLKAELWAVRDGLVLAREHNIRSLEIGVDALGVVQLINDNNSTNHRTGSISPDCRFLMKEFDVASIKYIYREANRCADVLTNNKRPNSIR
ncbi:hypothetical protein RHMOL_Rhmol06G0239800 [Rhododendron molle]|uniref:Uncharacterized protein n=1 Tax=Rhododendron molle TaxID=49168 RepID=A0ACC0NH35_RHOML|nr:hypothetical protein RHMOL_Rhmol06G0239800 [Rhododendron molle]